LRAVAGSPRIARARHAGCAFAVARRLLHLNPHGGIAMKPVLIVHAARASTDRFVDELIQPLVEASP
jgi:hypothetical protein